MAGPTVPPGGVSNEGTNGGVQIDVDGDGIPDNGATSGGGPVSEPEVPGVASGGSGSGSLDPSSASGTAGAAGEGGAPGILH